MACSCMRITRSPRDGCHGSYLSSLARLRSLGHPRLRETPIESSLPPPFWSRRPGFTTFSGGCIHRFGDRQMGWSSTLHARHLLHSPHHHQVMVCFVSLGYAEGVPALGSRCLAILRFAVVALRPIICVSLAQLEWRVYVTTICVECPWRIRFTCCAASPVFRGF